MFLFRSLLFINTLTGNVLNTLLISLECYFLFFSFLFFFTHSILFTIYLFIVISSCFYCLENIGNNSQNSFKKVIPEMLFFFLSEIYLLPTYCKEIIILSLLLLLSSSVVVVAVVLLVVLLLMAIVETGI